MNKSILIWIVRLTAAVILLQTLYFKFTGAEESVYIFSTLGMEPYGRIGSGVDELIAAILILIPRTTLLGALIGAGVMLGAIFSHLFVLGIEVKNDGGELFALAIITFLCCVALIYWDKSKIINLLKLKL
ncbi:DoxX-like protein [Flavobacterium sp. 1]|uniref:DoxX family protein n=1 Tax=Flavobacterium sp. 1 TaxID=2035200 RepID=UPI000C245303|nr:DoxX family protein [Flavobacterium sp. 1]PJJ10807.1 DoxX-like protein [Flavobacterium sp. 1]